MPFKRERGQLRKIAEQKKIFSSKNKRWVVNRERERKQIHDGITGSERCLQNMKRRLKRTILIWYNYHAVSLSTERQLWVDSKTVLPINTIILTTITIFLTR
jgi:hypothetical protein